MKKDSKQINIEFNDPDSLQSMFATNMIVMHQEEYFTIMFYEVDPPIILASSAEEHENNLKKIEKIKANCIAKIVVTPKKYKEFMDVMQINFDQFKDRFKKEK